MSPKLNKRIKWVDHEVMAIGQIVLNKQSVLRQLDANAGFMSSFFFRVENFD